MFDLFIAPEKQNRKAKDFSCSIVLIGSWLKSGFHVVQDASSHRRESQVVQRVQGIEQQMSSTSMFEFFSGPIQNFIVVWLR